MDMRQFVGYVIAPLWLEFRIDNQNVLHQTATFRPLGLWGRLYWYSDLPFHGFIFKGMIRNIAKI